MRLACSDSPFVRIAKVFHQERAVPDAVALGWFDEAGLLCGSDVHHAFIACL